MQVIAKRKVTVQVSTSETENVKNRRTGPIFKTHRDRESLEISSPGKDVWRKNRLAPTYYDKLGAVLTLGKIAMKRGSPPQGTWSLDTTETIARGDVDTMTVRKDP